jgi:deoxycytidylate deaminase
MAGSSWGWNHAGTPHTYNDEDGVVHAEVHAILRWASERREVAPNMYAVWACCSHCAQCVVESGIRTLYRCAAAMRREHPKWADTIIRGDKILLDSGVKIIEVEPHPQWGYPTLRFRERLWNPIDGYLDS